MRSPSGKIARLAQIIAVTVAGFVFSTAANAQVPTKGNVFFGYSYYNTQLSSINRTNLNGWEGSLEGKVFPFVGLVVDFSDHYGSQDVPNGAGTCAIGVVCSPLHVSTSVQTVVFGPRVFLSRQVAAFCRGFIRGWARRRGRALRYIVCDGAGRRDRLQNHSSSCVEV